MVKNIFIILLVPFFVNAQSAFISGNDSICSNSSIAAEVTVSFNTSLAPYTFIYAIDGINQAPITTTLNPHVISTYKAGVYTLTSFSDANLFGSVSGSALVTSLESPSALIHLQTDTLSIIYPTAYFVCNSFGNIVSWDWDFGDNTINSSVADVAHTYNALGLYQASLIVTDINGCVDTAIHNVWVKDEYWIYIPNSFTPDNEEPNNKFCIEYNGIRENTFLFKVFNHQGDLMFQSTDLLGLKCSEGNGWDGKYFDNNMDLPFDIYAYELYFQDFEGWKHSKYGTISLVR